MINMFALMPLLSSTPDVVEFSDWSSVITAITQQVNIGSLVGIIAGTIGAGIGFVFLWFGIHKGLSALMKAFKKGKLSV